MINIEVTENKTSDLFEYQRNVLSGNEYRPWSSWKPSVAFKILLQASHSSETTVL